MSASPPRPLDASEAKRLAEVLLDPEASEHERTVAELVLRRHAVTSRLKRKVEEKKEEGTRARARRRLKQTAYVDLTGLGDLGLA